MSAFLPDPLIHHLFSGLGTVVVPAALLLTPSGLPPPSAEPTEAPLFSRQLRPPPQVRGASRARHLFRVLSAGAVGRPPSAMGGPSASSLLVQGAAEATLAAVLLLTACSLALRPHKDR